MNSKPVRVVFAFYSGEAAEAEKAFAAIQTSGPSAVFREDGSLHGEARTLQHYGAMRLDGEALVVARLPVANVQSAIKRILMFGSPAAFVLRDNTCEPVEVQAPAEPLNISLLARLRNDELTLESARRDLVEASRLDHALTAAAEWILDNSYLARTQIAEVRRHLPKDYAKTLPSQNKSLGYSTVYQLARQLAENTDLVLTETNIADCLRDYQQQHAPLSISQLWLFPLLLQMALIAALSKLAVRVNRSQQWREAAYLWANRLATGARRGPDVFAKVLALMETEPCARQPYFVTSLAEQLQDEESALAPVQHWIEDHLNSPLSDLVRTEHAREAADRLSTANAFGSLRVLSRLDFKEIFEGASVVEAELRTDPGKIYSRSDFTTRDQCRRVVERIARYSSLTELDTARRAVELAATSSDSRAAHVAYYLLDKGLEQLEAEAKARIPLRMRAIRSIRRNAMSVYLSAITILTACFLAISLRLAWETGVHRRGVLIGLGILALFPLSELTIQVINALVISLLPPEPLPKMDFQQGIPDESATLVVVPMLLTSMDVARREVEKLEVRFLANQDRNLFFSLFSDFTDAPEPSTPEDDPLVDAARRAIDDLNERYTGGHFLLFHRKRVWSESEQMWIGRERKRGKIEELNEFLVGASPSPEICITGTLATRIRFVITLDSDTQLPPLAARRMIETISHPLNRAEIDASGIRLRGFTVIQPRVSIALPGATATRFTRIFADTTGTDPYCQSVSDAHQDLFGEAMFHGKAIYDVAAFRATLRDRFPAETILSHDLIEGAHAGTSLASNIELFENLPLDYAGYSRREHRWIRGDWQIAPWIFSRVPGPGGVKVPNPLSTLNRWRIFDNLRRSLVPVASMLMLILGWLVSAAPGVWSLVVGLAIAIPTFAPLLERLARRLQGTVHRWQGAEAEFVRAIVMITFLPHQAWVAADAIARVHYRRYVSRRHLLEWQTADSAHHHGDPTFRHMLVISALSAVLLIVLYLKGAFTPTAIFLALWIISPVLMRWLSSSAPLLRRARLDRDDLRYLRRTARRTWRFFDDLVGPNSSWLPPDNTQLALRIEVAQRTSPTNIGLWLGSALAATDLGYLTTGEFLERCSNTLDTISRLETYEGHLLNWYDTRTLEPLSPRYVSTVDSGNLLASLWVLERGCQDVVRRPILGNSCLRGLSDTLSIVREVCGSDPSMTAPISALRRLLLDRVEGHHLLSRLRLMMNPLSQLSDSRRWQQPGDERSYWVSRMAQELSAWGQTASRYLQWMDTLSQPPDSLLATLGRDAIRLRRRSLHNIPSLTDLVSGLPAMGALLAWRSKPGLGAGISSWLAQLSTQYEQARAQAAATVQRAEALAKNCARFAAGINMRFLYDANRRLFGVGYAVGGPVQFNSHYDLLASECRLASLVSIAKGDVPIEHWFTLGRPRASAPHGHEALLSWSGTMFEYLMPLLFMRSFDHSLLDLACREAVREQIVHGRDNLVPWGVSECAFSALDAHQIYQYRAFGIPSLALKPGTEDDPVVAPYATMLALLVSPAAAVENLRRMETFNLAGPMGFYEAIDFNREASKDGGRGVVIYAYMAHHQGMSLIALDDVLHREAMRQRFHSDVRVRAIESLLFERIPITRPPASEPEDLLTHIRLAPGEETVDRTWTEDTAAPRVHLHGNGSYSIMLTNSGGGYSRWNDFDLTRWRSDPTLDSWGSYIYVRDLKSDSIWSVAHQPLSGHMGTSSVRFSADRAEFQRRVLGIETVTEITVAAEDDAELRRVTVTNRSLRSRQLEFTSYAELSLAPHRADTAHPVFAKMFVETELLDDAVLIAHHRPRSPDDAPIWAAHILAGPAGPLQFETDRARFLGRGNDPSRAAALRRDLSGSVGTVLDPIFSLRCRLTLEPRDRVEISYITLAAGSREALLALIARYRNLAASGRALELAWTRAQLEFRYLGIGPAAAHRFQELASYLLFPNARWRAASDRLARNRLGQTALWSYGISGDLPIIAITVTDARHLPLLREVLLAHTYWRLRGLRADLVVLDQESPSYDRPLHQQLLRQIEAHSIETGIDRPGGVFLRDWQAIPEEHRNLILSAASVVLSGARGPLQQQLVAPPDPPTPPPFVAPGGQEDPSAPLPFLELPYFNGIGGFTHGGNEYAIYLKPSSNTPVPWANIIANPYLGTMITESGLGFTWAGNSQANRLTPWHNDPVSDPQSEIIYIRDDNTGTVWTPTPLPIRERDAYRARHGQGYTVFEHNSHAIEQELTVFVPAVGIGAPDERPDPVKICRLRLRNASPRPRRLTITYFAEWVLGPVREDQQLHVQTSHDQETGALLATQYWTGNFGGRVAFAASSPSPDSWSGDRAQFFGVDGTPEKPEVLERARLDNRTGAGCDPAAALQLNFFIEPGHEMVVIFMLGEAASVEEMHTIVRRYQDLRQVDEVLAATRRWWDARLGVLQVRTPALSTDFLLNRWLPYQVLSCRFWGRSALYQSGGAFGFRDQLQDSMAFLYFAPELTREHILRSAARQFLEGDVQHWWHPESGNGVRTQCSDDMAWLPYVVTQYVNITGDVAILDAEVPFIEGPELKDGEHERMFIPAISAHSEPLWEHCRRAIDRAWRLGPHGLTLFGTGDWNDGMNLVGIKGHGESVWLAWFLCDVLESFANLIKSRPALSEIAKKWKQQAADLSAAIEQYAWDGSWYLRGFFDDGSPLGSHVNSEARIDSIAQSWAVLSGAGQPARARHAMESAERMLVDEQNRLVMLFTPPFDHSQPHPGYIMGYPPGLRENGGQYTHGSLWMAAARARMCEGDAAVRLLMLMSPVENSRDPRMLEHYRGEPYVSAADVYSAPGHAGQSGWTWYTGSAGWMYRIWIEDVLGFRLRGDLLSLAPSIPDSWDGFEIHYRYHSSTYEIAVRRRAADGIMVEIDARHAPGGIVRLVDDGRVHHMTVWIPQKSTTASIAEKEYASADLSKEAHAKVN